MIRAANIARASMVVLALAVGAPALAAATTDCARAGANRTACRANSVKPVSVDSRGLGSAIAAVRSVDRLAWRTVIDANSRLAADTRLIEDSAGQAQGAATTAFMRALESNPVGIGSRIKRLRAGAANMTASTMSGAAIHGESRFSLTGRVGSFGGTRAAAVQMGSPISDRLAFNAGVTKGFNKVRETVGRVGITLGW